MSSRLSLALLLMLASLGTPAAPPALAIYTDEWPPITFLDDGQPHGMAVELVKLIQRKLRQPQPIKLLPWARAYNYLLTRPNVLLFTLGRSPEREKQMTMLGPVAEANINLYARRGEAARLRALGEALYRQPLTAFRSSIFLSAAKRRGFVNISESVDPEESASMLYAGRVALWSEGDSVVPSVLRKARLPPNAVEKVMLLERVDLYLAFSRHTAPETVRGWERALRELKQDGSYQRLHQRWLPGSPPPMRVELIGLPPG
ncbi:ABC transporter substrate-binding protein [Xenophilus sp. AP218F]|nr:transporter substrate-binding domain-containing protein [Chromobacterium sp. ASV5]OWY40859.1 ABC transporter substrate-binding protein [Xenophilus sp. AP218F]